MSRTALHWAAKRGHKAIVQTLLQHGADANITNFKGETAAQLASRDDVGLTCRGGNAFFSDFVLSFNSIRQTSDHFVLICL